MLALEGQWLARTWSLPSCEKARGKEAMDKHKHCWSVRTVRLVTGSVVRKGLSQKVAFKTQSLERRMVG